MIATLFVEPGGPYFGRTDVDPWDAERDARRYAGPHPVVAHPRVGWGHVGRTAHGLSEWTCEVWQSAYGHQARKRTWLWYVGDAPPADLDWRRDPGTHQVGWFDRAKPTLSKRAASATPSAFAEALIELARASRR